MFIKIILIDIALKSNNHILKDKQNLDKCIFISWLKHSDKVSYSSIKIRLWSHAKQYLSGKLFISKVLNKTFLSITN